MSKGTIYSQPGSNVTLSCFITGFVAVVVHDYDDFEDFNVDDAPAYRDICCFLFVKFVGSYDDKDIKRGREVRE